MEIARRELAQVVRYISEGHEIVVGSGTHKTCHFKELTMAAPRVWEIRSRAPKPGMRLFGMFADTDVFIGTNVSERLHLGDRQSREFKTAIRASKAQWRQLFLTYQPKRGAINDYISQKVTDARDIE